MSIFSDLFPKKSPKKGGIAVPSYLVKTATGSTISDDRENAVNKDLTTVRYNTTTAEVVREFAKNSPDVSHALELMTRFVITDAFTLIAKDVDTNTINPQTTIQMQAFAARLNRLATRYDGFSAQSSINSTAESCIQNLLLNGTCAGELVLDKALLPQKIQAVSTNTLKYQSAGDHIVPVLTVGNVDTPIDTPALCIISLSQDPSMPYAESWYKSALQSVVANTEFVNDLRKSFRKASLPRVKATIDTQKYRESLSTDVIFDQKKIAAAMNQTITDLKEQLNGLNPEDAVINFDVVDIDHLTAGNISSHDSVATHAKLLGGSISAGLHILPSLLGRGESQTTSSTEAILFLKLAESVQSRLNEFFSYLFTLAARLQGQDVIVDFKYKKPGLRSEIEEESFLAMKQSRILEQLSLGLISDEEASIALTGDLPSGDFTPLSGTRFHGDSAVADEIPGNLYSNTSVGGSQLNSTQVQKDTSKNDSQPKSNSTTGN